jgi:hypothetical protein
MHRSFRSKQESPSITATLASALLDSLTNLLYLLSQLPFVSPPGCSCTTNWIWKPSPLSSEAADGNQVLIGRSSFTASH